MSDPTGQRPSTGVERAALVLLGLGETHGAAIWKEFSDTEIATLAQAIGRLGSVASIHLGAALSVFAEELAGRAGLAGTPTATEQLMRKVLPQERIEPIVERIRRPSGPDLWEQLARRPDDAILALLATQHDQTAALILARLPTERTAAIMGMLPTERALAVLERFARLDHADGQAAAELEDAVARMLAATAGSGEKRDPATEIAEIFGAIDQKQADALLERWMDREAGLAQKVRGLMFTFADFEQAPASAIQGLLRVVDRDLLALALKGAPEPIKALFLDQMSARAARFLEDQIVSRGPTRRKDVSMAQSKIVSQARELERAGEIRLRATRKSDEEDMVA